mmetsp:Transcript_146153/g.467030  ORF Transcript_146153/g.467030 Transcript_146153/m.467030 type:complete len:283 (+) Transcript_146153:102-950(+)
MVKLSLVLLLGVAATGCSGQGFLKHLPKIEPPKITSPAQLAEAAAKQAAKVANDGQESVVAAAAAPASAAQAGKDALDRSKPQEQVAKALEAAGDALKHASDNVAAANISDVSSALSNVGDSATPQGEKMSDIIEAAQKSSKQEVADTIRESAPKVSGLVDQTGHKVAETVQKEVPKAAALVDRTASHIADAVGGPVKPAEINLPSLEEIFGQRSFAPMLGLMFLVMTALGGYFVAKQFKTSARSPMLLSDTLDGTARTDSPQARGGSLEMRPSEQAAFARF